MIDSSFSVQILQDFAGFTGFFMCHRDAQPGRRLTVMCPDLCTFSALTRNDKPFQVNTFAHRLTTEAPRNIEPTRPAGFAP
jgi:hypothetical protein